MAKRDYYETLGVGRDADEAAIKAVAEARLQPADAHGVAAEQLRQALAANPEARYSMEELSIADAFADLPDEMRQRLKSGARTGE